ncbi:hypothetical protein [Streptomyces griseiscabiei]|uniref:hypothetical protein n=1 Tax=Streptomyces griseiscabiei TaxID=2993540 RepID=UPI0029584F7E|nr:hypothetical protein [Streptomyces griseiscabiei]
MTDENAMSGAAGDMGDISGVDGMDGVGGVDGVDGMDGAGGSDGQDGKADQRMKHDGGTHDGGTRGGGTHGDGTRDGLIHDGLTHDLTHRTALERDIALLLADAADDVEVGIAPYQAVVRGGRRRRARRWAVAAAAAVVIAGTTGTLALAGASDGGGGGRVQPAATSPASPEARRIGEPWRTTLAEGKDRGAVWRVAIDVWDAPRDKAEAEEQFAAMALFGDAPTGLDGAADLVGKSWHFVHLTVGGERTDALIDGEADASAGTDLEAYSMPLRTGDRDQDDAPERLVIGQVAPTARTVRVTWSDDTFVDARRDRGDGWYADLRNPRIVQPKGAMASWFVALAPEGVGYKSAQVTG